MTKKKPVNTQDGSEKLNISDCCNTDNNDESPVEKRDGENRDACSDPALKLEEAEKTIEDLNERLLRTMAEFDNYKKRVAREKEQLVKFGIEKLALELLPVVDNFERAIEQAGETSDVESVIDGVKMIFKQLVTTLEKFHIKSFNSIGEPFNPEKHEAMAQQENSEMDDNTVIHEVHKGYHLGEKLLRPARVIVSREPDEKEEGNN